MKLLAKCSLLIILSAWCSFSLAVKPNYWMYYVEWNARCAVDVSSKTPGVVLLEKNVTQHKHILYVLPIKKGNKITVAIKPRFSMPFNARACKTSIQYPMIEDKKPHKGYMINIWYDEDTKSCNCYPLKLESSRYFMP